jgi:hypothetical protein
MRIYSNTLLSWPQIIHVFQAARLHPGKWLNYHFYKIKTRKPLILTTYSPIELLQENNQYYCYDRYYRDTLLENCKNCFEPVSIPNNDFNLGEETWCYIPKFAESTDIIVVRNDITNGFPSIHSPSLFRTPGPVLA